MLAAIQNNRIGNLCPQPQRGATVRTNGAREERLVFIHSLEEARLLEPMEQREERLVLIHSLEEARLLEPMEQREERLLLSTAPEGRNR